MQEEFVPTLQLMRESVESSSVKTWLNPTERKVAMLHAAGMSMPAIAIQMQWTSDRVENVLKRAHVSRYITTLIAAISEEITPVARQLTVELEAFAGEALDRQVNVMRTLDRIGDEALEKSDLKNGIRAKLGVLASTQDILDRAGKRAPTRTIGAVAHIVAPESLERLERIMTEVAGATRT